MARRMEYSADYCVLETLDLPVKVTSSHFSLNKMNEERSDKERGQQTALEVMARLVFLSTKEFEICS